MKNMNQITKVVTEKEVGEIQISIAQVKEVLRILNDLTGGEFYPWIKAKEREHGLLR